MRTLFVIALVLIAVPAFSQLVINEAFISMTGTDYDEYIEICGPPDMSLDGYAVLVIEGQGSGWGYVDRIWPLDGYVMPADGFFAMTDDGVANQDYSIGTSNTIENGTETILIVQDLPVDITTSTDVDTNDDGVEEISVGTDHRHGVPDRRRSGRFLLLRRSDGRSRWNVLPPRHRALR